VSQIDVSNRNKMGEVMTANGDRTSVEGQGFVVFGAAGGIGAAICRALAERRARVLCADAAEERCAATADAISLATDNQCLVAGADICDPASIGTVLDRAIEAWGRLEGVVNCVGITGTTGIQSHEVDCHDFRHVLDVNLVGAFHVSQAAIRRMLPVGYGRIIHLASIAGKEGNAGMVAYSASKAGLIGMVKSQGKEYATSGITINAIAPAVIWTSLVDALPEEQIKYMTDKIPMARCGTLSEIADLVLWMASPAASFTTGFTYDLSGGRATY
jgi:3-oxoacyl-[acyl-carrier protein] reductase